MCVSGDKSEIVDRKPAVYLLDKLGLDAFNRYVERLATFIIDKKAHVKNHYDTILKWYEEDTKVN